MHKFLKISAIVILLLAVAAVIVPWKNIAQNRLQNALASRGYQNPQLNVASLGFKRMDLENISIGADKSRLTLQKLSLDYSWRDLWRGYIPELNITGITVAVIETKDGWAVNGFAKNTDSNEKFLFPVTDEELAAIPATRINLKDSSITFNAKDWEMRIPIEASLDKSTSQMNFKSPGIHFKSADFDLTTGPITAEASLKNKIWDGQWNIAAIALQGGPELPPLAASGKWELQAERFTLQGKMQNPDGALHAQFKMDNPWNTGKGMATIQSAAMPWNGGKLSVDGVNIPLSSPRTVKADLQIKDVSMQQLLSALTGNRVSATGTFSGHVPIALLPGGAFVIDAGQLRADAPGTITMTPETIPGDQPQVALLRDVLKNLHYSDISANVSNGKDGKIAANIVIQGNNPDLYNGRPVKLNLNLTGDVLHLIQQSIILFNEPEKILERLK
jgi:hypothetical protein